MRKGPGSVYDKWNISEKIGEAMYIRVSDRK
jgi:hypothetical protein